MSGIEIQNNHREIENQQETVNNQTRKSQNLLKRLGLLALSGIALFGGGELIDKGLEKYVGTDSSVDAAQTLLSNVEQIENNIDVKVNEELRETGNQIHNLGNEMQVIGGHVGEFFHNIWINSGHILVQGKDQAQQIIINGKDSTVDFFHGVESYLNTHLDAKALIALGLVAGVGGAIALVQASRSEKKAA